MQDTLGNNYANLYYFFQMVSEKIFKVIKVKNDKKKKSVSRAITPTSDGIHFEKFGIGPSSDVDRYSSYQNFAIFDSF